MNYAGNCIFIHRIISTKHLYDILQPLKCRSLCHNMISRSNIAFYYHMKRIVLGSE